MQEKYRWRTLWRFLTLFLGLLLVGFAVPVFGQVQEENSSPDGLPTDDAYLGETMTIYSTTRKFNTAG